MATLSVDSYHVNIGNGDCSFHILAEYTGQGRIGHRCVLLDGGSAKLPIDAGTNAQARNPLREMMGFLATHFSWPNGFKIDTVVVSHWDEDHYGNLLATIQEDARYAIQNHTTIPYFKYDAGTGAPQTFFYCPNVLSGYRLNSSPSLRFRYDHGIAWINILYISGQRTQQEQWVPFCILRTCDPAIPGSPWNSWNSVLGAEFFYNSICQVPLDTVQSLERLAQVNPPRPPYLPSMYCIGVQQKTLGPELPEVIPENPTITNRVSIVCIICWADTGRISHYLAGDADQETERRVLTWLTNGGHTGRITSIKLSHHGSRSSTPLNMLMTTQPRNIVLSIPSGLHIHPTLEILWFLRLWSLAFSRRPAVLATKYPHFFAGDKTPTGVFYYKKSARISVRSLENPNDGTHGYLQYWQHTEQLLSNINQVRQQEGAQTFGSILTQYQILKNQGRSADSLKHFLLDGLVNLWNQTCHPGPKSHPSVGAGFVWPDGANITESNQVHAILILNRNDDSDGTVFHKYFLHPTLFDFNQEARSSVFPIQQAVTAPNGVISYQYFYQPNFAVTLHSKSPLIRRAEEDEKETRHRKKGDLFSPNPDDVKYFYVNTAAVVPGKYSDPPPTDPNEDSDAEGQDDHFKFDVDHKPAGRPVVPMLPLALTATAPSRPSAAALGGDDGYYYFASIVDSAAIQKAGVAATQYTVLTSGTPLDAFVSVLHTGNLSLTGSAAPSPGSSRALLKSDEFGLSMTQALNLSAPGVSMTFGPASTPAGLTFAVSSPGSGAPLLFSTDAVADAFGINPADAPPLGILATTKVLMFGLDSGANAPQPITATLSQLVDYAGITYLQNSPAVLALKAIKLGIPKSTTGRRNAVWFEPLKSYRTITRLEMDLDDGSIATLNGYIKALAGLQVKSASVIARRTSVCSPATTNDGKAGVLLSYDGSVTFLAKFQVGSVATLFDTAIEVHPAHIRLMLVMRDKLDVLQTVFDVLAPLLGLGGKGFPFIDWLAQQTAGSASFPHIYLRCIVIDLDDAADSRGVSAEAQTPGISSVQLDLETRVTFGSDPGAFAIFLLTYTWNKSDGASNTLHAGLWASPMDLLKDEQNELAPDYEAHQSLGTPVTLAPGETWPSYLDLSKIGGFENLPKEIPHDVTEASLTLGSGGIAFSGSIMADKPTAEVPAISLNELKLNVSYLFGKKDSLGASLLMRAMIRPAPGARNGSPAMIMGQVVYDGGSWKLTALVENIYGSTLYQFFDPDTGSGIGSILDGIGITALGIEYDYAAGGGATNFAINGDLVIGSLGLSLDFKYAASGWTFEAYLDVTKTDVGKAKLSDVIKYVFGDHADDNLPDFILDISVVPPNDKKAVGFDMTALQVPEGATDKPLLFTAWLDFLGMSFQAIQYQPPAPGDSKVRPPARRIFVLAVNSLPPVDIPLIGNLTQPFDELLLLYVSAGEGDTAMSGVTYADLKTINGELQRVGRRPLPYRATKKQYADEDVVLTIGAHFILVLKDTAGQPKVMLDYVFYTPSTDSKALVGLWQESGPAPAPAKAPYEKRIGPLSIRNMGFKYSPGKEPMLSITMDASVALGPIALDLLGFSLDLTFEKGMTLLQLPTPSVSLSGLGVAFDRPPVILAGMFEHRHVEKPVEQDYYQGAVTLSFQPYLFTAAGYYGTTNAPSGAFISAFVYFVLNGPLIELEFAEINGVTGGFGYNTFLHFPNPTSVLDFPFLRDPGDTDPSKQLTALVGGPWFFPQDGAFWLAAGLSVKALQVLQVRLVLAVEWNPSVQLGLFGVATADMPAGSNDSLKIMHVELGITAIFDFSTDTLRIEGQLAPSSFVWNPFCHLSGGFAYYQWFRTLDTGGGSSGDAPIPAGDFVFTVGGYHRNFKPPAQYPSAIPRLSISWSFDSAISITGEAYFAITPNVVMAGGRLDASLSAGPLSAWFDAWADLLINYKPFHFTAYGGVSVGVEFTLDLWICTIHISIEIGATLFLAGPPLQGTVHVDFWVHGFDIDFGDSAGGPEERLILDQFYELLLQADLSKAGALGELASVKTQQQQQRQITAAPRVEELEDDDDDGCEHGSSATLEDPPSNLPPPHVYSCNEGLIPTGDSESTPNKADEPWRVRGAVFQFTVGCKFAIDSADVVTGQLDPNAPKIDPHHIPGNGQAIYARPMHLTDKLRSTLTVTITPEDPPARRLDELVDPPPLVPVWDNGVAVTKPVPKALWGMYSATDDPNSPFNPDPNHNPNLLQPSNTGNPSSPTDTLVPLTMGVTLSSPLPRISTDWIPSFNTKTFFVRNVDEPVKFPSPEPSNPAWYPRPLADGGDDEWEYVRAKWDATPGLGVGAAELAVKTWAGLSFAGWRVDEEMGDITGRKPGALLDKDSGEFERVYLEAMRVCAVA